MTIPDDWTVSTAEQLCHFENNRRIPVSESERAKRPGDIPYYGANGLQGYIDYAIFNEDLILLAEDGGHYDDFTNRPIAYRITGPAWVNNHAHAIRSRDPNFQNFLFYSLEHKDIRADVVGGTRGKLNLGQLKNLQIAHPVNVSESIAIAEIIQSADDVIRFQRTLISKLEMIRRGLLKDFFSYGIDEEGALRSPETHDFGLFGLNQIPSSWEMRTLESLSIDVIDGDRGKNYPKKSEMEPNGYCLFLSAKNVTKTGFKFDEKNFITQEKHETLRNGALTRGDIVITTRGTVGQFGLFSNDIHFEHMRINSGMAIIRNNSAEISNEYLFMALNSDLIKKQISQVSYGTAQQQLNIPQISNLMIPFCSSEEQTRLLHSYNSLLNRLDVENRILDKYRKIKLGLMNDLLTSRVRVPTPSPDGVEVAA